ncbi:permease (plasmid) [Gemmatirosa kalamazoonensis]|uniref:Permease n=1 Tax=Gemmatirosa kalamazoonensis TaxID=861299 RepID=W0RN29_9BACT|nr:ABC transporter permease [Gemmatirosa kalamazoonensis]AHG92444.1 permease [Gemmatirosa kalamazoonensis]
MRRLVADLSYAARTLRRQPAFAAAALLTLALGIGATTAMLTVARAALVRAVPFDAADRLVQVSATDARDPTVRARATAAELRAWRDGARAFAMLEGFDGTNLTLTGRDAPERLQGIRATPGFLAMLRVRPAVGRAFVPADSGAEVAVLSDGLARRLGAAVGSTLTLDGRAATVIGVLPRDVLFAPAGDAEVWLPVHDDRVLSVVGRLRDGATVRGASTELATIERRLATRSADTPAGRSALVVPLREAVVGPTRPLLVALGGGVALVLLVACANVASLFLARALGRAREMAVRTALGAGRARIARQLLTESLLVAALGGAAGAALAALGVWWLAAAAPAYVVDRMPFLRTLTMDPAVLGATLVVVLATGVAFGLVPALQAGRLSTASLGRRDGDGSVLAGRARRALVVGEIALTTVLLVGAGLMTRSVVALLRVDPGFATEDVVTTRIALAGARYDAPVAQQRFFEAFVARARELPGVRAAGAVSNVPLAGSGAAAFRVEGAPEPASDARPTAMLRGVAGDYFRAMGIRVLDGRPLGARDDADAPRVVVVSEGLPRRLFAPGTAVGRRIRFDAAPETAWTVVGVVADVRATSLDAAAPAIVYRSHLQAPENRMTVVLRASADPAALVAAMRRAAREVDPTLPVYGAATMATQVASTPAVYVRRSLLVLLGGFALAATTLAAVGVYGVVAYAAARRTREMGIRAALGATAREIATLVLRQGAALAATGIVAGLVVAAVLARALATLLYGVRASDVMTFAGAAALLAAVTLVASLAPARRAARVHPAECLRAD